MKSSDVCDLWVNVIIVWTISHVFQLIHCWCHYVIITTIALSHVLVAI